MLVVDSNSWILLLYSLPTQPGATRVQLWRQLKKCGALALKTSGYLLPNSPEHHERLQWLAHQVRDGGGEATIVHAKDIEGLNSEDIKRQFRDARAADYEGLLAAINLLIARNRKQRESTFTTELERLTRQFDEIREIDFFNCARAQDVQMLLKRAGNLRGDERKSQPALRISKFIGKTWLTRPRPEIDRTASAWLIRRFIDPKAKFLFGNDPKQHPTAIPYDMFEVEFSHHADDSTFETLVKRFGITDKAVKRIAEMVHDADLEDGKYQAVECIGIDRVLKGWGKIGLSDAELLKRGGECFEGLYQQLKR